MHSIHTHPGKETSLGLDLSHVIIDKDQFLKAQQMEKAMLEFIRRVDIGEINSVRTYNSFKEILGD